MTNKHEAALGEERRAFPCAFSEAMAYECEWPYDGHPINGHSWQEPARVTALTAAARAAGRAEAEQHVRAFFAMIDGGDYTMDSLASWLETLRALLPESPK